MAPGAQAGLAAALAASVGVGELLSRYRSSPAFSARQPAAISYVLVNAGAGALALYLVRAFGWNFNQTQDVDLWRILVAGFGAVALFRSSIFITKVGSTQIDVGLGLVLGALLSACDRSVDRESAIKLSAGVADEDMAGLDPDAVQSILPVISLALMQNFPDADQALLANDLKKVGEDAALTADAKMRAVIVALTKYLGPGVVAAVLRNSRALFTSPIASHRRWAPTSQASTSASDALAAVVRSAKSEQAAAGLSSDPKPEPGGETS